MWRRELGVASWAARVGHRVGIGRASGGHRAGIGRASGGIFRNIRFVFYFPALLLSNVFVSDYCENPFLYKMSFIYREVNI
jgi:hypothetical protein